MSMWPMTGSLCQTSAGDRTVLAEAWTRLSGAQVPKVKVAYLPILCNHCDDAPCMAACPVEGAIYKREDGLVIIDPVKCTGCKNCAWMPALPAPSTSTTA